MIQESTLFILGAGASKDFMIPTSKELLDRIISSPDNVHYSVKFQPLKDLGHLMPDIYGFCEEIMRSGLLSIDAFLETRKEYIDIGKAIIASLLIPYEREQHLFIPGVEPENNWYKYIFNKMRTKTIEEFVQNRLNIITFNYDRSFEHFFYTSIKNSYNLNRDKCRDIMDSMPIIHVHGKLGNLPWQGGETREYNDNCTNEDIGVGARSITVIGEGPDSEEELQKAHKLIHDAKKIIFLGFGYHHENLERLKIKDLHEISLMGSSYGMGRMDRQSIAMEYNINLNTPQHKIYQYLREEVLLV